MSKRYNLTKFMLINWFSSKHCKMKHLLDAIVWSHEKSISQHLCVGTKPFITLIITSELPPLITFFCRHGRNLPCIILAKSSTANLWGVSNHGGAHNPTIQGPRGIKLQRQRHKQRNCGVFYTIHIRDRWEHKLKINNFIFGFHFVREWALGSWHCGNNTRPT